MVGSREMNEHERQFYKRKMKSIKAALQRGDKAAANRHAEELKEFFNVR